MKELAYVQQQNEQTLDLLNRWCERRQLNMDEWSFPLKCAEDLGRLEDSLQENKDLECSLHGACESKYANKRSHGRRMKTVIMIQLKNAKTRTNSAAAQLSLARRNALMQRYSERFRRRAALIPSGQFSGCGVDFCLEHYFSKSGHPSYVVKCLLDQRWYLAIRGGRVWVGIFGGEQGRTGDVGWRTECVRVGKCFGLVGRGGHMSASVGEQGVGADIRSVSGGPAEWYHRCECAVSVAHVDPAIAVGGDSARKYSNTSVTGIWSGYRTVDRIILLNTRSSGGGLVNQHLLSALAVAVYSPAPSISIVTVCPDDWIERFAGTLAARALCVRESNLWKFLQKLCSALLFLEGM
ncbi:hypothetical protein HPB48_012153 [Haemaphysalis longicornis]|uniref:Uncharacterized protein n=1 Tax=Haemaphysalis longicornis TaxID=44386 RepID=A0A9J6FBG2_HAELO|nr:hypothetical protein HPB48_012153 [Haemaphysalis longicornis]